MRIEKNLPTHLRHQPFWVRARVRFVWPLLVAVLAAVLAAVVPRVAAAAASVVTTPQVRAELVVHAPEGLVAGQSLWLGLKLEHQPHWHTYWKNPGDSGLPTALQWTLPPGLQVGEIQWPTPSRLPIGPLMNYGFEGTLLLPVQLKLPADFKADTLEVKLQAQWLVCKEVCIPEDGEFTLRIAAQQATAGDAALFASMLARVPADVAGAQATAAVQGPHLTLRVSGLPVAWQGQSLQFFPELGGVINNAVKPVAKWEGGSWVAQVPLDAQRSESPVQFAAVLKTGDGEVGQRVSVAVTTPWPAVAALPALQPLQESAALASPAAAVAPVGLAAWLGALLLAAAGGALLNLMPCVFPVLSLKVLGFSIHAQDRRTLLAGGLAYTAGVVLSFLALAGLMLALRAGGEQLGWGFQLQSPLVITALALLFTLIGLNLAGVFELGSVLPSGLAAARARHPIVDSALTGVLAVAVASPCTAPFMGAALGLALGLPVWQALAIFAALGLGMALPYLLASAWPALARALPRPGVWMSHFKTAMAFPMFATVVWLLWVLGQQVGIDGAAAVLGLLVVLAFAAWAWGSPQLGPKARRGFGITALVLLAAVVAWAWPVLREQPAASAQAGQGAALSDADWGEWSADAVTQAQAQGRPVFVDFTAAWCVTCQLNKRTTLNQTQVSKAFAEHKVLLLRADWTRRDSAISAELTRLQRSGVPVYALYAPGQTLPRLLPEILSVDMVVQALNELPAAR